MLDKEQKPILIAISSRLSENQIQESYEELKKATGTETNEKLIYFKNKDLTTEWYEELIATKNFITENTSINKIPHIALLVPASFALSLGIILSQSQIPEMAIYHFQANTYSKVIDLTDNSRKIKEIKKQCKKIDYEKIDQNSENLAIIIQFASHSARASVIKYLEANDIKTNILEITHKNAGNIQISDWSEEVSEIYSVIQNYTKEHFTEKFHIFLSAPIPIAFALGLALGSYIHTKVYQYTPSEHAFSTYIPIFSTKML